MVLGSTIAVGASRFAGGFLPINASVRLRVRDPWSVLVVGARGNAFWPA